MTSSGEAVSLGQKQLIAFMRAVLRDPEDPCPRRGDGKRRHRDGAIARTDILAKLPSSTTKVIIAHRLNTIADADEIFFINAGTITPAGSMEHALEMLLHGKRDS